MFSYKGRKYNQKSYGLCLKRYKSKMHVSIRQRKKIRHRLYTLENKRLRGFEKIELQPGETKTVTFRIPASALAFVGADNKWRLEEGDFNIICGKQIIPIKCTETQVWDTPNIGL